MGGSGGGRWKRAVRHLASAPPHHKLGRALRTETTINDARDFRIGKRLHNLPALARIGFTANRRLLHVQRLSHDPITGADAFARVNNPITTEHGERIPGLRFADPRVHALLAALCVFRLIPGGFANRDLRALIAPLLGVPAETITTGKMTYDLRRLRLHGLIERIPHTFRYRVTDTGLSHAMFLTRIHDRVLRVGLSEIGDNGPPRPRSLRAAERTYQDAINNLIHRSGLAA
jgi:hypothetical protein